MTKHMIYKKLIDALIREAQEDWQARRLCLPSLVAALALHDMDESPVHDAEVFAVSLSYPSVTGGLSLFPLRKDGYTGGYSSVGEAVRSHNTYLAGWKGAEQIRPNWEGLAGQTHYILAVQYLQDAKYSYYQGKKAEAELVEIIERNGLYRYDRF